MSQSDPPAEPGKWKWQLGVAIGLLAAFGALVAVMWWKAPGDDIVWQRRVYVFGAVEALVFTAVGWIFGREVHREAVRTVSTDAARSKRDATEARESARKASAEAAAARARGDAVRAAARHLTPELAAAAPPGLDAGPRSRQAGFSAFLDELYGEADRGAGSDGGRR